MAYRKSHIPSLQKLLSPVKHIARVRAELEILGFASAQAQRFRQMILAQGFESFRTVPLSPEYLKRKIAAGADPRVMVSTKNYVEHVSVHVEKQKDGTKLFYIGFLPTDQAKDMYGEPVSITLAEVARVQEHGSHAANIPARPHWTPFFRGVLLPESQPLARRIARMVIADIKHSAKFKGK